MLLLLCITSFGKKEKQECERTRLNDDWMKEIANWCLFFKHNWNEHKTHTNAVHCSLYILTITIGKMNSGHGFSLPLVKSVNNKTNEKLAIISLNPVNCRIIFECFRWICNNIGYKHNDHLNFALKRSQEIPTNIVFRITYATLMTWCKILFWKCFDAFHDSNHNRILCQTTIKD